MNHNCNPDHIAFEIFKLETLIRLENRDSKDRGSEGDLEREGGEVEPSMVDGEGSGDFGGGLREQGRISVAGAASDRDFNQRFGVQLSRQRMIRLLSVH